MNPEYLNDMTRFVRFYNSCGDGDKLKTKLLTVILAEMYKNKFGTKINYGVLLPIIKKSIFHWTDIVSAFSKEKLEFEKDKNQLKIGECFLVREMNVSNYGHCISIELIDKNSTTFAHFLLTKDKNSLLIDRTSDRSGILEHYIVTKPYNIKGFEKRIFDSYGIEIERHIIENIELSVQEAMSVSGFGETIPHTWIETETKLFRDLECFEMVKIETKRKMRFKGDYELFFRDNTLQSYGAVCINDEKYGTCPDNYSLDILRIYDSREEAITACHEDTHCLNKEKNSHLTGMKHTDITLNFIPNLNDEIIKRVEEAKVYCRNHLNRNKK